MPSAILSRRFGLVFDLGNGHPRARRQNGGEFASRVGIEMNDDHEGGIRIDGNMVEEALKCLNAAC